MGIVTSDDIFDVAEEEATEDIHRLGGMEALDIPYSDATVWMMVQKRVGWLIILFIGGILTSVTLQQYEQSLSQLTILMFFFPLIVSSGGNSGSQAATLVIRAMALQEVQLSDWYKVLLRELVSGFFLGLTLGIFACILLQFWTIDVSVLNNVTAFQIILTVSISVVGTVMIGTIVGSMLPFILRRIGLDPAMSSTPFVATLADITGVIVYFSIAQLLLWRAFA
jgi:magnesium transporter